MRYKTFQAYNVKVLDPKDGIIEAIVSVFNNIDNGDPPERVMPGAYTKSLERKYPKGIDSHNWEKPIAKTLDARELLPNDPQLPEEIRHLGGLYIKGQLNLTLTPANTPANPEAYKSFSNMQEGIIDEFSIGFEVEEYFINKKDRCIDLLTIKLYEWSPVLFGMNPATQLISVKSLYSENELLDMNGVEGATETKNELLGNIEESMTIAALDSLYCRWWWKLVEAIYYDEDDIEEICKDIATNGAELIRVTVNVIRALMSDPTQDGEKSIGKLLLQTKGYNFTDEKLTINEKSGAKHSADTTKTVNAAVGTMKEYSKGLKDCHKMLEDMLAKGTGEDEESDADNDNIETKKRQENLRLKTRLIELRSKAIAN